MYATTTVRMLLAPKWKATTIPTKEWQAKIMDYAKMAKLMAELRNQEDKDFKKEWGKFITYLREHCKQIKTLVGL